jgi:FkbM family methyltransferase
MPQARAAEAVLADQAVRIGLLSSDGGAAALGSGAQHGSVAEPPLPSVRQMQGSHGDAASTVGARRLVYDIGVHTGEDTGYYLHKGFRVVGVEANPTMAAAARERFADAIGDGRLTLLEVGIAEDPGASEFYVCDDVTEWSSFDRSVASRDGAAHHAVTVETREFASILAEYGTPWYLKVDIEGKDHLCLAALRGLDAVPAYVSVEMDHDAGDEALDLLRRVGYDRFKIISQSTRAQPLPAIARFNVRLPVALSHVLRGVERELRGVRRDELWRFPRGSSGPFAEDTPGPWRDHAAVLALWRQLRDIDKRRRPGKGSDWFDIHATRSSPAN